MNTQRTLNIPAVLRLACLALGLFASAAMAQSSAELLEKGIYTEETVGDLSAAMEIYGQLLEDAEANRPHVAQAQYRLAMCYLKQGNEAASRRALETLIRDFPNQTQLVAEAREQLANAEPALVGGPVPWLDGEFLEYRISLPTGMILGSMSLAAHQVVDDGIDAWRFELRRLLFNNADNFGVSNVWVDADTQQPIRSVVRHQLLGNADTTYGTDGIAVVSGDTSNELDYRPGLFDNEQSLHLMRMLPLKVGYSTKLHLVTAWTAKTLETRIEVTGREPCSSPAGDFECFVLEADIGQTVWVSTGPERLPVKIKAEGVLFELQVIGQMHPQAMVPYSSEEFGISGTLPSGWLSYEVSLPGRPNRGMIRLADPEAATISALEIDRCPRGRCPELLEMAQKELAGATRRFKKYEMRADTWSERTIGGQPAISFAGDYLRDGEPWVQYRAYTFLDDVRLEFIFRTPRDRFDSLQGAFDAVLEQVESE